MSWQDDLKSGLLPWLLDEDDPGARYLAMKYLLDLPGDSTELIQWKQKAHTKGPIAQILSNMDPAGFWEKPGAGYNPKYRSGVWSVIALAQLGASADQDPRIQKACDYILENTLTEAGQFSSSGAPSGTIDCLQGNLCAALLDLGCADPRLDTAFEWMARTVTGEGIAPASDRKARVRYYAGKYGPDFQCGANNKLACAWGAVKVMLAFGKLPVERRTGVIEEAIDRGVMFLLSVDPADATYPCGWAEKPSGNWWKFGFPVFYVTDILQVVEALTLLGYGNDPRLARAWEVIQEKQDPDGRWPLEYSYSGKTWAEFGEKKEPNKWVTIRALTAMRLAA